MARPIIDLAGKQFGRLEVLRRHDNKRSQGIRWVCLCSCGKEKIILGSRLREGVAKSCGCLMREYQAGPKPKYTGPIPRLNLEGHRYGRLVVLSFAGTNKHSQSRWNVRCDCGVEKVIGGANIRQGQAKSCGCLRSEVSKNRHVGKVLVCRTCGEKRNSNSSLCTPCRNEMLRDRDRQIKAGEYVPVPRTKRSPRPKKVYNLALHIWQRAKVRAKQAGLEFTIKVADIVVPELCPVLGIVLRHEKRSEGLYATPSLDRTDNTKGYVPGNVEVISYRANVLKRDATHDEIIKLAEYLKGKQ